MNSIPEVAKERTGWRDEALSLRHREWGQNCPMVDIDFLVVEYDSAEPRAIIEYKHEFAKPQLPSHPSYQAIAKLADRAQLPFFAVRYTDNLKWFTMSALNPIAKPYLPSGKETLSEREFVSVLYAIRNRRMPCDLNLNHNPSFPDRSLSVTVLPKCAS